MDAKALARRYLSESWQQRAASRARVVRRVVKPVRLHLAAMRTKPVSTSFGWDRGVALDRHFIEHYLHEQRARIRGRVLEVGDDRYASRWSDAVDDVEVLNFVATERTTIVADLQDLAGVPSGSFDCLIVTQVLQYLDDPEAGVAEMARILRPDGVALVTVPCLARVDGSRDRWRFLPNAVQALFSGHFAHVEIATYGNCLTGMGVWSGMAVEDIPSRALDAHDPDWPVLVAVTATPR